MSALTKLSHQLAKRPWLISALIVVFIIIWLLIGQVGRQADSANLASGAQTPTNSPPIAKVAYQTFLAQQTDKSVRLYGKTEPIKIAYLSSEIGGVVEKLLIRKGQLVKKNQLIALIGSDELPSQLVEAKSLLSLKEQEYRAATALKKRGLQGEVALAQAKADLEQAKSNLKLIQTRIAKTKIKAPMECLVNDIPVEVGDFIKDGTLVANCADLSTMIIKVHVNERDIYKVKKDQKAKVFFINGVELVGKVTYLSKIASKTTNTFALDIEINNPNQLIPAGVSASVELLLNKINAIKITPAVLALDAQGGLGVKIVQHGTVVFKPIQLVKAEKGAIWLTGLGKKADIITRGQGFVRAGDNVEAIKETVTPKG